MDTKILHDLKYLVPWELWYSSILGSCRILSINRMIPSPSSERVFLHSRAVQAAGKSTDFAGQVCPDQDLGFRHVQGLGFRV